MKRKDAFEQAIESHLLAHGLKFRGIRLRCTHCKDKALAASPEMARAFGWSKLKRSSGANYKGLCVSCTKK